MVKVMMQRGIGMSLLFGSIFLALPLALLTTALVARSFRARVAQIMRELAQQPASVVLSAPAAPAVPARALTDRASRAQLVRWRRHALLSYLVAASVFALIAAITFWHAFDLGSGSLSARSLLTRVGVWLMFATPLPLGLVTLHSGRVRSMILALSLWLAVLLAIGALCEMPDGLTFAWRTWAAAPTLVVVAFASRRLRAGAPLLLTAFWLLALAAQVGLVVLVDRACGELDVHFTRPDLASLPFAEALPQFIESESSPVTLATEMLSQTGREPIFAVAHPERASKVLIQLLGGWILAVALTFVPIVAVLLWQARRYRARRTSDVQLSLDITFLLYAVAFSAIILINRSVSPWAAAAFMGAFVAYRLIRGIMLRRQRTALRAAQPMPLLLLRTFGHDARTQALIESVSSRWRWLGPIHLIAGTDSAFATLAPHDFYDYLSGQLARRAVTDPQEFQRLARAPALRDPDGLYRVETHYCHADTWQRAVEELIQNSAAVLMDLRGFSSLNAGVVFELSALARRATRAPVVLLVDGTTNLPALDAALGELRANGSPDLHVLPEAGGERRTLISAFDLLMAA